jgi:hypothetical protein
MSDPGEVTVRESRSAPLNRLVRIRLLGGVVRQARNRHAYVISTLSANPRIACLHNWIYFPLNWPDHEIVIK